MLIPMNLGENSYDIVVERGILATAGQHLNLNRRVLVVTDDGVPSQYAETVAAQCQEAVVCTIPQGEDSKSLDGFSTLLQAMLTHGFSRKDCVVAVGGGVVGDLARRQSSQQIGVNQHLFRLIEGTHDILDPAEIDGGLAADGGVNLG